MERLSPAQLKKLSTKQLQTRHAALHTIYSHLVQGLPQADWTIEALQQAHKEVAEELRRRGITHESPLDEGRPDRSSHTRFDYSTMDDASLLRAHANLHSLASKIEYGEVHTGWTMDQVVAEHEAAVGELMSRGFQHESPMV